MGDKATGGASNVPAYVGYDSRLAMQFADEFRYLLIAAAILAVISAVFGLIWIPIRNRRYKRDVKEIEEAQRKPTSARPMPHVDATMLEHHDIAEHHWPHDHEQHHTHEHGHVHVRPQPPTQDEHEHHGHWINEPQKDTSL